MYIEKCDYEIMQHLHVEFFLDVVNYEYNEENEDKGLLSSKNEEFPAKVIDKSAANKACSSLTNS